jgi:hypothetical protein
VLLLGFDLTYRPLTGKQTIEILPIADAELANAPVTTSTPPTTRPATPPNRETMKKGTSQRYTLRVHEQPVGKVLDQLGRQLHLEVSIDTAAIEAAGKSLDQRVSFDVKDADLPALLDALLQPAGLTYERNGQRLNIHPQ